MVFRGLFAEGDLVAWSDYPRDRSGDARSHRRRPAERHPHYRDEHAERLAANACTATPRRVRRTGVPKQEFRKFDNCIRNWPGRGFGLGTRPAGRSAKRACGREFPGGPQSKSGIRVEWGNMAVRIYCPRAGL